MEVCPSEGTSRGGAVPLFKAWLPRPPGTIYVTLHMKGGFELSRVFYDFLL